MKQRNNQTVKIDHPILHNDEIENDPQWFSVGKQLLQDYSLPPKAILVPQNSTLHGIKEPGLNRVYKKKNKEEQ